MAKVRGEGIDPKSNYRATPLVGRGLFALTVDEANPAAVPPDEVSVKVPRETARKLGRLKQPGETLASTVNRLLLAAAKNPP